MAVSGIVAQQAVFRTQLGMEVLKNAADSQKQMADLITATVDATRGQNLDIKV